MIFCKRDLKFIAEHSTLFGVYDPHKYLPEKEQANEPYLAVKEAYPRMKDTFVALRNTARTFECAIRTSTCQKKSRQMSPT